MNVAGQALLATTGGTISHRDLISGPSLKSCWCYWESLQFMGRFHNNIGVLGGCLPHLTGQTENQTHVNYNSLLASLVNIGYRPSYGAIRRLFRHGQRPETWNQNQHFRIIICRNRREIALYSPWKVGIELADFANMVQSQYFVLLN